MRLCCQIVSILIYIEVFQQRFATFSHNNQYEDVGGEEKKGRGKVSQCDVKIETTYLIEACAYSSHQ